MLQAGQTGHDLRDLGAPVDVPVAEAVATDSEQHLGLDLAETGEDAADTELRRAGRPHRAETGGGDERDDRLRRIGQVADDTVAGPHPERLQSRADAGDSVAELAGFFHLDENLVDRAVRFLVAIGHVRDTGGTLSLTDLGHRSVRDDVRYETVQRDRRALYFDGFGCHPLSRRYYGSTRVTFLSGTDEHGYFKPVMSTRSFNPGALDALARDPKRDQYNLPGQVENLRMLDAQVVFLPAYIVRTLAADGGHYVVYTQIGDEHDEEITGLYGHAPEIAALMELEENATEGGLNLPRARKTLAGNGLGAYEPVQRADGTWQVVVPPTAFRRTRRDWR